MTVVISLSHEYHHFHHHNDKYHYDHFPYYYLHNCTDPYITKIRKTKNIML